MLNYDKGQDNFDITILIYSLSNNGRKADALMNITLDKGYQTKKSKKTSEKKIEIIKIRLHDKRTIRQEKASDYHTFQHRASFDRDIY